MLNYEFLLKYKYVFIAVTLLISFVAAIIILYVKPKPSGSAELLITADPTPPPSDNDEITVDVSGAVMHPLVYKLPKNSRVIDALKAAGGVSKYALVAYLSQKINLADPLHDGQKIYIPTINDNSAAETKVSFDMACVDTIIPASTAPAISQNVGQKVNINSASKAELVELPGIGDVYAEKIIQNRPYTTMEKFYELIKFNTKTKALLVPYLSL